MPLERIRVDALRCLQGVDCRLHPQKNYFFGPNGAGKTSFLEAVFLLGRGRSFRTRQTKRLVQHGRDALAVFAELRSGEDPRRLGVSFGSGGIEFRIDRRPAAGVTEIAELFRVDVIDPGIHNLIEGGPSERRRFLDWGVFHVEHGYLAAWRKYRRALGQRNAALKQRTPSSITAWTEGLVEAARAVDEARRGYVARLAPLAVEVGAALLESPVRVAYRRGWRADLEFSDALAESQERDLATGYTQVGPHRADLSIALGEGGAVADEASRGQQKLIASALLVAQVREGAGRRDSVLLVDDPAAELDRQSLGRLLAVLHEIPCQLIVTGLSDEHLRPEPGFPVFHVERGDIKECYNGSV